MRSLLYIVICFIALSFSIPVLANKPQLPHQITLKLHKPAVSGQSLMLTTELSAAIDFYQGSASLVISSPGTDVTTAIPIEVFPPDTKDRFSQSNEIQLPPLKPGKYKIHGIFSIFPISSNASSNAKASNPIQTGFNLYLDVDAKQVLSSSISFTHLKRLELNAQLESRQKRNQSNDLSILKTQDPKLYQSINSLNKVQAVQHDALPTIQAKPGSIAAQASLSSTSRQTVALSAGQGEIADPRKQRRQEVRHKVVAMDKENAILEK